ncbi:hypothetical protein ACP4OV_026808 [Aristida adscensionis]
MASTEARITDAMAMRSSDGGLRRRRRRRVVRRMISVVKLNGDTIRLQMEPSETIAGVKAMVADEGVHPTKLRLKFAGLALDDSLTLDDCNIPEGSTLTLHHHESHPDPPEMVGIKADGREALPLLGQRADATGERIEIIVKTLTGDSFPLKVDPSETITGVKRMIMEKNGTPPDQQVLTDITGGKSEKLENGTLADYSVQNGSIICSVMRLRGGGKIISVEKPDGRTYKLEVGCTHTIDEIMGLIDEKEGTLKYKEKPLKGKNTLEYYGIEDNSTLHLVQAHQGVKSSPEMVSTDAHGSEAVRLLGKRPAIGGKFEIIVKTHFAKPFPLEVDPSETIAGVKKKIMEKTGIPPDPQRLIFEGKLMYEENYTLASYNIPNGSTIWMVLHLKGGGTSITAQDLASNDSLNVPVEDTRHNSQVKKKSIDNEKDIPNKPKDDSPQQSANGGAWVTRNEVLKLLKREHNSLINQENMEQLKKEAEESRNDDNAAVVPPPVQPPNHNHPWFSLKRNDKNVGTTTLRRPSCSLSLCFARTWIILQKNHSPSETLFFIATALFVFLDAVLAIFQPEWGDILVCVSSFFLAVLSGLLIMSFDPNYAFAILLMLALIILVYFTLRGLESAPKNLIKKWVRPLHDWDTDAKSDDTGADEYFDHLFDLSQGITNCGALITAVMGGCMVGLKANVVGCLFVCTVALGLYLMTVTTVSRSLHATYLALMLMILLDVTLIVTPIYGRFVHRAAESEPQVVNLSNNHRKILK